MKKPVPKTRRPFVPYAERRGILKDGKLTPRHQPKKRTK